jgi:hypothetical protein
VSIALEEQTNCYRCASDIMTDEKECAVLSLPPHRFTNHVLVFPLCSACTRELRRFLRKTEP